MKSNKSQGKSCRFKQTPHKYNTDRTWASAGQNITARRPWAFWPVPEVPPVPPVYTKIHALFPEQLPVVAGICAYPPWGFPVIILYKPRAVAVVVVVVTHVLSPRQLPGVVPILVHHAQGLLLEMQR